MGPKHVAKMGGVGTLTTLSRAHACLKLAHISHELGLIVYFWVPGLIPMISKAKKSGKSLGARI